MPILTGDIKLVASQVMGDVPEGGGAPTSTVIVDGTSNAIFPDISELDRAGGRVNLRKLHVSVQTLDTDTYMGSNIIVAEPPADPNVSVTLFTTNDTFDRRAAASSRVESYLNRGGMWGGYLLEDHIAGQKSIMLQQEVGSELPSVGQTMVLVTAEGTGGEVSQYIRTTAVSYIVRVYTTADGKPAPKWHVTCNLSDSLRINYPGSPGGATGDRIPTAARVRDTVVSDAGTYVGVSPLTVAADLGDFTVTTKSIFTQLVPSAQTETPISDVRTNGMSNALVATGGAITQSLSLGFSTSQNLFVGGPIFPGSLTVTRAGVTVTDAGGTLISAAVQVGTVDYDNGILSLSTNVFGTGLGTHTVTFTPAAVPELISDQRSIRVTAATRSQSYAFTMARPPLPRTMSVSFLAQGRWYVLRDAGGGVLKGISSDYGIGTINYTTGSVVLTLGALPDVSSSIIIQSYSELATVAASNTLLRSDKAYVAFNSDGVVGEEKGSKAISRKTLVVNWTVGGVTKVMRDMGGLGALTGDGTGTVDYANGIVRVSPTELPPAGTMFLAGSLRVTHVSSASTSPYVAQAVSYGAPSMSNNTLTTV